MKNFFILFRKDWLELVRSRRLLVMAGFILLMAITSPIFAKIAPELVKSLGTGQTGITITIPEPSSRDAIDQYMKNLGGMGVLILIFLAAGSIAEEKARRTIELILVKPVERIGLVFSKLSVLTVSLVICNIVGAGVFISYTQSLFHQLDIPRFLLIAGSLLVYQITILALTVAASSIAATGLVASGYSIGLYAAMEISAALIPRIQEYMPSYIIGHYRDLVNQGWDVHFTRSTISAGLFIVLFTALSLRIFSRQEIER